MPLRTLLLIWCAMMLFANSVFAQAGMHYNFSKVERSNGLSHNQVYAIHRDSVGFVWFGTRSGLNRFDGHSCKIYEAIPGDPHSLPENNIVDISDFPHQKLWIASSGDVAAIYDPLTDKFDQNYKAYLKVLALPQEKPQLVYKDGTGAYWFLFAKSGLYRYASKLGKATRFIHAAKESNGTRVRHLYEDFSGALWIIYANGLVHQLDRNSLRPQGRFFSLAPKAGNQLSDFRVFVDRNRNIWAYIYGEPKGIYHLNTTTNTFNHYHSSNNRFKLKDNMVTDVVEDKWGNIWIGTDQGGVNVINKDNYSQITYLVNEEYDNGSLSYNSIEDICQDRKGIIWVATGKKGVNYINQNIMQFALYKKESRDKNKLPYNDINYFVEDKKGNLWIGTNGGGLVYFDRLHQTFTQYLHHPSDKNSLSNNVIVSLCLDHEDKLWIGTYLGGLDVFDGKTFTHYRHNAADPNSISDDRIWHIMEDDDSAMWIGTLLGGLNRFDRKTKKFIRYYSENNIAKPIHSNYISMMRKDRQGNIWIGTSEGIEVLNKSRTKFTYYPRNSSSNSISHKHVLDILEDRRGLVWIGTRAGLNVLDRKTGKISSFFTKDGLPDNTITNLVEDKQGNLWVTTLKGLCQLIVQSNREHPSFTVRVFNETNNLQGIVFNESAGLLTSKGEVLLGGAAGFNIIEPEKLVPDKTKAEVVFTSIDIFNNEVAVGQPVNKNVVLRKALPFADEIKLRHTENIFSIEFAALDFSGNNQYAYKLEGFNKTWMYANSSNRKVTYTNLSPGIYYFKVKATNADGIWSDDEKSLKIIIAPPFWQTPLAFAIYVVVIAGILYLARSYTLEKARMCFELEQQKRERERIQALDAVKTKFFTNVSHEFRTPISLILTPLERMMQATTDPAQKQQVQLIQRNAKRLLNLVNQLLDFRKMEVQEFRLEPTMGDIVKFIREITYSFSDLSEMKRIALSFSSNVDLFFTYFDKDKLEKILFNLLSNAFKYTFQEGRVEVAVAYSCKDGVEVVKVIVKDSGIGIPKDKQDKIFERFFQNDVPANSTNPGTGIGLAIAKEFVKLHKGTISVESETGKGAAFTVTLPVQKIADIPVSPAAVSKMISQFKESNEETRLMQKGSNSKPAILLVEDNDDFRFYLKDNLNSEYCVIETTNGQEAWDKLQEIKPDLIVSDVMMPLMDGIELAKRVKRHPDLISVPIILLTAVGDEEMQLESCRLGVADFMTKPFTYEILASRINNLLAQQRQPGKKLQKHIEVNPTTIEMPAAEEQFLKQVLDAIEKNMSNPEFTVEELSRLLFMHRAGVYRKLLALTGMTPLEFIRSIRLKRGRQLLEKKGLTVSEIAYQVGFNNPKKFSQYFKEKFGVTPTQFQKNLVTKADRNL